MPSQQIPIPPPLLGLNKRASHSMKTEGYTADSLNVWPTDWDVGRERISTRPGISRQGTPGGRPYNWAPISWADDGAEVGIAVVSSNGLKYAVRGFLNDSADSKTVNWKSVSGTSPGTNFASVASYLNKVYVARFGTDAQVWDPTSGSPGSVNSLTAAVNTYLSNTDGLLADGETDPETGVEGPSWEAPNDCGLVQAWGDRLVFAGSKSTPHIVFMSKVGDPLNWDYSSVTRAAAVATSGIDGVISEPVTSLIPHNRQCLLVGCTDSIYVIRGNPAAGGNVETLSHSVGPLEQSAWCKDGEDRTWMMTRDGLYVMPPGCGQPPTKASRQILPDDLVAINPGDDDKVAICYDNRFNGIHIFVNYDGGDDIAYFYDLANGGYWKQDYGETFNLGVTLKSASTDEKSGAMLINTGGTAYAFDKDSGESISSYCYYGPVAVGSPISTGVLISVEGAIASGSNAVNVDIYGGDTPEEAYLRTTSSFSCQEWSQDGTRQWQYRQYPRVRCAAAYVKISSDDRWAVEEIAVQASQTGNKRV